jgi:16S rRNA (uracil1498-N3)-methyltransferase
MNLFFTPDINSNIYQLNKEESLHCVKVLRLKEGNIIYLTNGEGSLYECRIISNDIKACTVEVINTIENYGQRNYHLHIAIAPTKNIARIEWFIEKAVEIGIDEITPLICEHSERVTLNLQRLEKIIISAMKQSFKTYKTRLNEPSKFLSFIHYASSDNKYIAYCDKNIETTLNKICPKNESVLILIGPEGDFSKNEIERALEIGIKPVSLGKSRLRTETAGLVACHTVSLINE